MNDKNFSLYHRSPPIKPQEGGGRSETAVQAVVSFAFLQNLPLGESAFSAQHNVFIKAYFYTDMMMMMVVMMRMIL